MPAPAWILIAIFIAVHLVVDLIVPLLMTGRESEWLFAAMLGVCVGQINLIGVWAAMAPGRVMLRLPWSIFLATLMWYFLVLGNRLRSALEGPYSTFPMEVALQIGLILLVAVLLVQIPLWAASRLLRWRLLPPLHDPKEALDERQFNIKHLIIGMVVSAVALGMGRVVLPAGEVRIASLENELMILLPAVAIVNLIVVVPCIWGAFVRGRNLAVLAMAWVAYAVVITVIETALLIAILGAPGSGEIWFLMTLFNLMQCVCVFVTLVFLRGIGFRLERLTPFPTPMPVDPQL